FSRWTVLQPQPGLYLWRSPHGWIYLATNTGTHDLGNNPFAHAVWKAARKLDAPARTAGRVTSAA
ncbi:MAG: hypothetical protein QOF52_2357, partial [Propionibacteriaceae bacterium]|nr:hypothetical protein [Propionibacteriaceae bacterium]